MSCIPAYCPHLNPIERLRRLMRRNVVKWQVAGDKRCAAFIALAEDLKEQFRPDNRERHIAQFVDDQQFDGVEMLLQRPQSPFVSRFHEFMHKSGRRREGDGVALLAGGEPESQGDMGFARAGRTSVIPPGVRRARIRPTPNESWTYVEVWQRGISKIRSDSELAMQQVAAKAIDVRPTLHSKVAILRLPAASDERIHRGSMSAISSLFN